MSVIPAACEVEIGGQDSRPAQEKNVSEIPVHPPKRTPKNKNNETLSQKQAWLGGAACLSSQLCGRKT
jgi:hypothetical protein